MTSKMTKDTNSRFEAVPPLSELNDGDAAAACDAVPEYCDDVPSCADVEDCSAAQESCVPDDFFDDAPASEPEHEESLAVKSADSDGFVVEKADLTVPTLLEASAGTGKTFSIKHLVLRLIVEQEIPINSLLVVTFTKAATAELKSRIREHLAETHGYLTGIYAAEDVDPLVVRQVEIWRGMSISDEDAVKRLRESLARFDDSAINTIHGFCQKMLSEHVFTSAGNFDTELSDDDAALRDEVTESFLRRELDACTSADERRLLMQGDDWAEKLRTLAGLPEDLAKRVIPDDVEPLPREWLERFIGTAPAALRALKRARRLATYDDLLAEMWLTLRDDATGAFVAGIRNTYRGVLIDEFQDTDPVQFAIFRKLFLEIPKSERSADKPRALFFVGDPKQAIYSFRSADLDTYMRARKLISRHSRLGRNFRSCPKLVEAVNRFFSIAGPDAFLRHDLAYKPVDAKVDRTGLFLLDEDGIWREADVFEIWYTEEGLEGKDAMNVATARSVADDIARLITLGRDGRAAIAAGPDDHVIGSVVIEVEDGETKKPVAKTIALRAVEARDIAILVQKRGHVDNVKRALARRGVRVVMKSNDDVFRTEEAHDMLCLLHAFAEPGVERVLTALRATRLMAATLSELCDQDEQARSDLRERLEAGVARWRRAGAAAALSAFIDEEHLAERLLPVEGGEQRLTNYAHIIELLNEAGRKYATPAGLLSWFESARAQKGGETRNLRLASDANLVTVETIHSSKGLQYPIVYLPSAESMAVMKGEKRSVFKQSDASGMELSITHGEVQESDALKVKRKEELVRLAYVAMTRAACRLVLVVPQNRTSTGWHGNYRKNAYFMALTGSLEPDRDIVLDSFRELGSLPGVRCVEIETLLTETADDITVAPPALDTDLGVDHAKPILPKWRVSSFSSINRSVTDDEVAWFGPKQSAGPLEGILAFPRGTKAGDAMHGMLEIADFPAVAPDTPEADALRRNIARSRIEQFLSFPDEASLDKAVGEAARMIYDVVNAEILPGIRLRDVKMTERASEMPFLLRMRDGLSASDLKDTLERFGDMYAIPNLSDDDLSGFLTGFIDLAFGAKGRFWILDWKSNAITRFVRTQADFTQHVMSDEMRVHRYRLQYLIYLVALRRFLKARLGRDYDDSLLGGACYVFLRGVSADARRGPEGIQGVVYDPVGAERIARLDELFLPEWEQK